MLRCWDAIAQLTCSAQRRSSAPAQVQPITTAQRRSSAAAHRRNCNQTTAQRRSSAAAHWRKRSLTTAQRRSSAQAQGNNSAAAQRNLTTAQRRSSRESIARTYRLERRSGAKQFKDTHCTHAATMLPIPLSPQPLKIPLFTVFSSIFPCSNAGSQLQHIYKKSFQNIVFDSVFPIFPVKQTVIYTFFAIKAVHPSKTLLLTVFL